MRISTSHIYICSEPSRVGNGAKYPCENLVHLFLNSLTETLVLGKNLLHTLISCLPAGEMANENTAGPKCSVLYYVVVRIYSKLLDFNCKNPIANEISVFQV